MAGLLQNGLEIMKDGLWPDTGASILDTKATGVVHVMCVDSLLERLNALVDLLDHPRIAVVAFPTGHDLLQDQRLGQADLVLTCVTLSDMNGFELAHHLRSKAPDVPVVLTSFDGEMEDIVQEAGLLFVRFSEIAPAVIFRLFA